MCTHARERGDMAHACHRDEGATVSPPRPSLRRRAVALRDFAHSMAPLVQKEKGQTCNASAVRWSMPDPLLFLSIRLVRALSVLLLLLDGRHSERAGVEGSEASKRPLAGVAPTDWCWTACGACFGTDLESRSGNSPPQWTLRA
jgi:hypothetical protein